MFRCVLCDTPIEDIEEAECPECAADPITGEIPEETVVFMAELRDEEEQAVLDEEGNKFPLFLNAGAARVDSLSDSVARAVGVSDDEMDLVSGNETAREAVLV